MTAPTGNGQRYTWIATWLGVVLALLGFASAAWIRAGAQEQRITNLESLVTSQAQQISTLRASYEDGIGHVSSDLAYIRGRVDYLSNAVTDIRQRR